MTDSEPTGSKPPSLVPGVVLLALAAVLIVVVLINPPMPPWARSTIASIAVGVVVALLGYAAFVMYTQSKRGRK